jgi:hypothetical protein
LLWLNSKDIKVVGLIKRSFGRVTLSSVREQELSVSRLNLQAARSELEFYAAMVQMYEQRVNRLEREQAKDATNVAQLPMPQRPRNNAT